MNNTCFLPASPTACQSAKVCFCDIWICLFSLRARNWKKRPALGWWSSVTRWWLGQGRGLGPALLNWLQRALGWSFWRRETSHPTMSSHSTYALCPLAFRVLTCKLFTKSAMQHVQLCVTLQWSRQASLLQCA